MRLRDMGLRSKDLINAAAEHGIKISPKRASEIINGQAFIKPEEMEVIAKLLNKTTDEVYKDIGSLLSIGTPYECEYWDWEINWCKKERLSIRKLKRLFSKRRVRCMFRCRK